LNRSRKFRPPSLRTMLIGELPWLQCHIQRLRQPAKSCSDGQHFQAVLGEVLPADSLLA